MVQRIFLVSKVPGRVLDADAQFFVPSMNVVEPESYFIPAAEDLKSLYLGFGEPKASGVFERILCLLLKASLAFEGSQPPQICKDVARVPLRNEWIFFVDNRAENELRISTGDVYGTHSLLIFFHSILDEFKRDSFGSKIDCFIVVEKDGKRFKLEDVQKIRKKYKLYKAPGYAECDGLWTFRDIFINRKIIPGSQKVNPKLRCDVFIAHDWGARVAGVERYVNHERAKEIAQKLAGSGLKVWIDQESFDGMVSQRNLLGIDHCDGVLILVTENYLERSKDKSTNVFKELEYAARAKPLILAVTEPACLDKRTWAGSPLLFHCRNLVCHDLTAKDNEVWTKEMTRVQQLIRSHVKHLAQNVAEVIVDDESEPRINLSDILRTQRGVKALKSASGKETELVSKLSEREFDRTIRTQRRVKALKSASIKETELVSKSMAQNFGKEKQSEIKFDVYLEHDWGPRLSSPGDQGGGSKFENHEKAKQLANELKKTGLKVWLDEDQIKENIVNSIINGMENSACVVFLITKNFIERSKNTKTHISKSLGYAATHKEIIPVVVDQDCLNTNRWEGPVGYHLGSLLYHNLSMDPGSKSYRKQFEALCEKIRSFSEKDS